MNIKYEYFLYLEKSKKNARDKILDKDELTFSNPNF